jgi:hypothetical protein
MFDGSWDVRHALVGTTSELSILMQASFSNDELIACAINRFVLLMFGHGTSWRPKIQSLTDSEALAIGHTAAFSAKISPHRG